MTYDVVTDFKTNANPNGPWSFYDSNDGRFETFNSTHALNGVKGWRALKNGESGSGFSYVAKNTTGTSVSDGTVVAPVHALAFVPGVNDAIYMTFTAPVSGLYRVKVEITGIQTNEESHPVSVSTNKRLLCVGTIVKYQQLLQCYRTTTLKAGDSIFVMDNQATSGVSAVGVGLVFNVKGPLPSRN